MSHKASRMEEFEKFEERRAKDRAKVARLKGVHQKNSQGWNTIEQEVREEIRKRVELERARKRDEIMLELSRVAGMVPVAVIAEELGVSRPTVYRWVQELEEG